MKQLYFLAGVILMTVPVPAFAKTLLVRVTPENIAKQPVTFTVQVKDLPPVKDATQPPLKEVVIRVQPPAAGPTFAAGATAELLLADGRDAGVPVTRAERDGAITCTFRAPAKDLDKLCFRFAENPPRPLAPFTFPGNYYELFLADFAGNPKK